MERVDGAHAPIIDVLAISASSGGRVWCRNLSCVIPWGVCQAKSRSVAATRGRRELWLMTRPAAGCRGRGEVVDLCWRESGSEVEVCDREGLGVVA